MPARIVICPVVLSNNGARLPLPSTLVDPGRLPSEGIDDDGNPISVPKHLVHVSAISSGQPGERNDDCLSIVAGVDMVNLDAAAGVIIIFESGSDQPLATLRDWLTNTPNTLGWNAQKRNRVLARLTAVGADTTGLNANSPLWQILNRLGAVWQPGFDVRILRTIAPGA